MNKAALLTILGSAIIGVTKSKIGSNSIEDALKVAGFTGGKIIANLSVSYAPAIQYEDGPSYGNWRFYGDRPHHPSGSVEEKIIYFNFGSFLKKAFSELDFVDDVSTKGFEQGVFEYSDIKDACQEELYEKAVQIMNVAIENNQDIPDALEAEGFYDSATELRSIYHLNLNPQDDGDMDQIRECIYDGIMSETDDEALDRFLDDFTRSNEDDFELIITINPQKVNFSIANIESKFKEIIKDEMNKYNAFYKEESDDEDKDFKKGYIRDFDFDIENTSKYSELRRF